MQAHFLRSLILIFASLSAYGADDSILSQDPADINARNQGQSILGAGRCYSFTLSETDVSKSVYLNQCTACSNNSIAECKTRWESDCHSRELRFASTMQGTTLSQHASKCFDDPPTPPAPAFLNFKQKADAATKPAPPAPGRPAKSAAATKPATASAAKPSSAAAPATTPSTGNYANDLATCQRLQQRAQTCCTNPAACGASIDEPDAGTRPVGMSMQQYCAEIRSGTLSGGQANLSAARTCESAYSNCMNTCSSFMQTHINGNSAAFATVGGNCAKLIDKALALSEQASSMMNSNSDAAKCEQMASSSSTQSLGDAANMAALGAQAMQANQAARGSQYGSSISASDTYCEQNPTAPTCYDKMITAKKIQEYRESQQSHGFQNGSGSGGKDPRFNLADNGDQVGAAGQRFGVAAGGGGSASGAEQVARVPNNSGGGIPGAGGGGGAGAGAPGANGPAAGALRSAIAGQGSGVNTDIEQGFQGAGGYSQPVGGSDASGFGDDPRPVRRGLASAGGGGDFQKINPIHLKDYLPGGRLDPKGPAATSMRRPVDIHGPWVDLFFRVNETVRRLCKEGRLLDCGPNAPKS
jgi:hypothetical protein